jgi:hypothetical protein
VNIAVLSGRPKTGPSRAHPDVTILSSDDFWERISGMPDFRARLLRATAILAWLMKRRAEDEVTRINAEAIHLGDADGRFDLEGLVNAPRTAREQREALLRPYRTLAISERASIRLVER